MNLSYARHTVTKATIENTGWQQKLKKHYRIIKKSFHNRIDEILYFFDRAKVSIKYYSIFHWHYV